MKLVLPLPPSVNAYWRSICRGGRPRVLVSRQGRAYKREAAVLGALQGSVAIEGEVAVRLVVYMARRGCDLDNRVKPTLDALTGVAYADDAQVARLDVTRALDPDDPRVEVEVTAMEAA